MAANDLNKGAVPDQAAAKVGDTVPLEKGAVPVATAAAGADRLKGPFGYPFSGSFGGPFA